MKIEVYGAYWDVDGDNGFIQLRGADGKVLQDGNLQLTSATKFTAILLVLESSRTAVWDPARKQIFTGAEVIGE